MMRELTKDERVEILQYWQNNPTKELSDVLELFEAKFGTPITETCILGIVTEYEIARWVQENPEDAKRMGLVREQ
jgi:hypothetical protein